MVPISLLVPEGDRRRTRGAIRSSPKRRPMINTITGPLRRTVRRPRRTRRPRPGRAMSRTSRTSLTAWMVSSARTSSGTSSVGLVAGRDEDGRDARPVRRQQLLLDAADRQHPPVRRDLTGHGHVAAHQPPGRSEASAVVRVTPAEGPSFGTAPAGSGRAPSGPSARVTAPAPRRANAGRTGRSWPTPLSSRRRAGRSG